MLHHVVPELVLHQIETVRCNLIDERVQLCLVRVVDASVHECAAHLVCSHIHAVSIDRVVDELVTLSGELLQERLDEVVSLVVLGELDGRRSDHVNKDGDL